MCFFVVLSLTNFSGCVCFCFLRFYPPHVLVWGYGCFVFGLVCVAVCHSSLLFPKHIWDFVCLILFGFVCSWQSARRVWSTGAGQPAGECGQHSIASG